MAHRAMCWRGSVPVGRVECQTRSRWFAATPWAIVARAIAQKYCPCRSVRVLDEHRHHGLIGEDYRAEASILHLPQPRHHWGRSAAERACIQVFATQNDEWTAR